MLAYLKDKWKNFIVSLRVSILSIFVLIFILTLIIMVSVFSVHLSEIVHRAAFLLMRETSNRLLEELNLRLQPVAAASQFTARNIRQDVVSPANKRSLMIYMAHLLKSLPLAQGAYWSDANGSFTFLRKQIDGSFTAELIDRSVNPPTAAIITMNSMHQELSRKPGNFRFDPRQDPWFIASREKKSLIWTDAYLYNYDQPFFGISVISPVFTEDGRFLGAFGIDLSLQGLSRFMWNLKITEHGETYIINKKGRIIASSINAYQVINNPIQSVASLNKSWLNAAFAIYEKDRIPLFVYKAKDIEFVASFQEIPILAEDGWMISVIDRPSDFSREIHKLERLYLFLYLLVFLLGVGLMSKLATRIVKPIKKLVKETERIKRLNLKKTGKVHSHIQEVIELSDSIYSMKQGLRSFQRYVPSSLVRQLIKTGEGVQIGGAKKELAILFTDIENFTTISESADSNQLVQQMCDYFESLTHTIIHHHGTIDKYIGDSIMAFWGAPNLVKAACQQAARAALACLHQEALLNEIWHGESKPILHTRIGIHYGEAIVGNIGSTERINYTALGDNVNIASRLVDVNKIYGTVILVSEPVYQLIKDEFVLRLVDQVTLKGKATTTALYELLATNKSELGFDIDQYNHVFNAGFQAYQAQRFQAAIQYFKECLILAPHDRLAKIFIDRCHHFERFPPNATWDGVWHLHEK